MTPPCSTPSDDPQRCGAGDRIGPGIAADSAKRASRPAPALLRPLLRRALLRGLRAPRLPHDPPIATARVAGASPTPLRLLGARGQQLAAWLVLPRRREPVGDRAADRLPAVLALHGWGANASTMWPLVEPLLQAGCAVMLLDASCHGDSGDEPFTSLPRFAEDLAVAADALAARPEIDPRRIALVGHSVGAAAALLYAAGSCAARAGRTGCPPRPRGVVSLSAFAHPEAMMRRWLAERGLGWQRLADAVVAEVQQVIGASFDAIAPLRTVTRVRCPVMLVHGLDDATVPVDDARRIHRAGGDSELLLVRGDHDLRGALPPHAPRIVRFLNDALNAS